MTTFSYTDLTNWREQAPWQEDKQVEQDLYMSWMLIEIFNDRFLKNNLALLGGTALTKLFAPAMRYSEDIDLIQIKPGNSGPLFDALNSLFKDTKRWNSSKGRCARKKFEFPSAVSPDSPISIKLEINTWEKFKTLDYNFKPFEMKSNPYANSCKIRTYDINELLGRKLSAIEGRSKERDIFDLWYVVNHPIKDTVNLEVVVRCAQDYRKQTKNLHDRLMERGENKDDFRHFNMKQLTAARLQKAMNNKKSDSDFCNAISRNKLLKLGLSYNTKDAIDWALETFLPLIERS